MNVLSKFTKKNLALNKKRTIVTGIGIVLSAALICAVAGMVTSIRQTLVNTIIKNQGDYHTMYVNVPKNELKYIEKNKNIKKYFKTTEYGYSNFKDSKNESKPYIRVVGFTTDALKSTGLELKKGRMPENNKEIVIPEHIISNGGADYKIGDKIILDIGKRIDQNDTYPTQDVALYDEETGNIQIERIENSKKQSFKIVGIVKRPNYALEAFNSPAYTFITYEKNIKNAETASIYVTYNNPKNYEKIENSILSKHDYKTQTNKELLRYEGALSEAAMNVLYGIAAIVIVIIIVSSVFVIRNSFSISVAEKNKQYGMLSSIGATKRQIRKSVLLEGLIIGGVAIPIGIICGIIAIIILVIVLNYLTGSMLNGITFVYSVPILPIILTVIISALTIYLSCLIPSIKASKITPIESIRGNDDVKIKAKKLKTPKIYKKLFGIGGVIASKNLKRSKKKYRTTIISLVVSISIFVSLSSFLQYGKKMTNIYYTEINYNIAVTSNKESFYNEILKLDNIKDYAKYKIAMLDINLDKYGSSNGKKINKDLGEPKITVVKINDKYFKKYLKSMNLSQKDYQEKVIFMDQFLLRNTNNKKEMVNTLNIKNNETITIGDNKTITVNLRTDKYPMGFEGTQANTGIIFIADSNKTDLGEFEDMGLYLNSTNNSKTETEINKIKDSNKDYSESQVTNIYTYVAQANRLYLIVSIFLYGFITVITLIGVTNIFNTITTNMILRSKEFAMLKSIGMTSKEFNKMIKLESILYGVKSLIIGIPIGLVGTILIYKSFAADTDVGYLFPTLSIIISIVFVFLIVGLTMKYSLNKINKQNIIETIRNDNI